MTDPGAPADAAVIRPARRVGGTLAVPGDKSLSHRALLFSALAEGPTVLEGLGTGQDVASTRAAIAALGVTVRQEGPRVHVTGRGLDGLKPPAAALDCQNSGTTLRTLMGLLAGRPFTTTLIGDASLSTRPMRRVADPLRAMGAQIALSDGGRPPVVVTGGALSALRYELPIASAQVKTALLLAGLQAQPTAALDGTTVVEPAPTRDHTERMLRAMGADLVVDGPEVCIRPGRLSPLCLGAVYSVPGDLSSAAFFLVAGALLADRPLRLARVGVNPTRTGILDVLAAAGAEVRQEELSLDPAGEPVADLWLQRSELRAVDIAGDLTVRAIDELPVLAVLLTQARGRSTIRDAAELRVKESDRIAATVRMLRDMGATVEERADGLEIVGPTPLHGATVAAGHDHRIAMAAAVAGLAAVEGDTHIQGASAASVSFPSFFDTLASIVD